MFVSSTLPKELPQVSDVTKRTTIVVNEAVDFAKVTNLQCRDSEPGLKFPLAAPDPKLRGAEILF